MRAFLAALILLLLVGVLSALGVMYSGVFNVAATEEDSPLMRWVLVTTRENSVRRRARDLAVPANLESSRRVENGFRLYGEMCAVCHTPPGRKPSELTAGLNPPAPALDEEEAEHMSPEAIFWVIRNGIRFTGMPAWAPTHSDEEIWDIVAFVRRLPEMTAADYEALERSLSDVP